MIVAKDSYKVNRVSEISIQSVESLMWFYQPLIGSQAVAFYLTLNSEGLLQPQFDTHQRLCEVLDCTIDELLVARKKCEQAFLIKTFHQLQGTRNFYLYECLPPLPIASALIHQVLGRWYYKMMGRESFDQLKHRFVKEFLSTDSFTNVSQSFSSSILSSWDDQKETTYQQIKPEKQKSNEHLKITFNTAKFLRNFSALAFPIEARTAENIRIIEEGGTLYNIDEEKMQVLVSRCVSLKDKWLDVEKLKKKMRETKIQETTLPDDPFMANSVAFLQSKQHGISVSAADKRLIEYLLLEMKLPPEVVNVLIDYALTQNDMRLSRPYVEKIASTLVRLQVKNKEEARDALYASINKKKSSRKDELPQWWNESENESKESIPVDESVDKQSVDRQSIIENIKKGELK